MQARGTRSGRTYEILAQEVPKTFMVERGFRQSSRLETKKASRISVKRASKILAQSARLADTKQRTKKGKRKRDRQSESESESMADDEDYIPTKVIRRSSSSLTPLPQSDSDLTDLEDLGLPANDEPFGMQINPNTDTAVNPLTGETTALEANQSNANLLSAMIPVSDEIGPSPVTGETSLASGPDILCKRENTMYSNFGKLASVFADKLKQMVTPIAATSQETLPLSPKTETSDGVCSALQT